ncbi:MAG: alanine racemase [Fusobacteriota bacterium]
MDLDKLRKNLNKIKKITSDKKIFAVVKANGYGHGMIEISKEIEEEVELFAVSSLKEAKKLLKSGIKKEILILGGIHLDKLKEASSYKQIRIGISNEDELKYMKNNKIKTTIHINIDTGMGRLGFSSSEIKKVIKYIKKNKLGKIEGIFTHFSSADDSLEYTKNQIKQFRNIQRNFKGVKYIHISNSAGIININDDIYNSIRPGILLYGIVPFDSKFTKEFEPILTLKSKILNIKKIKKASYIGYNRNYKAKRGEKIATISAGYGDGLSRRLSNRGYVMLKGKRCDIVGNICMDHMMISINPKIKDAGVGDEVTLIGEGVLAKKVAEIIDTIPYEVLTQLNDRVNRVYINKGEKNGSNT